MAKVPHPGEIQHDPVKGCAYGLAVVVLLAVVAVVAAAITIYQSIGY